jgi:hypothetical protein|uniref:Growth arrest-specific protein 8 domain-containing protein n=1 Tax=Eutreptiella gymnastica TaxID=73025 RepID=A0A7S4LKJ4_9EUGL|mmetsp:Transcript_55845/g.92804  ORF Transcript_55845/g.92804 Transcript_55845/m.92804 type:complete len:458 (-) Transcript_55845:1369-2742(-)|eukprot:CAMPEP_0174287392 /NCGR_PEP_ID=MMETSP0809-20121228/15923_1 /TAXON_ID=73025 ORGANISM="Eutreptiella gymnastica-like, Strain CCMP1594" /NCGR_SAMPLE_ID=MMETSP0809 /ASSEMBLY_ACC=CAM_ASM_000658 /LENGTH=457 /DNA_ID=CAMNT_0015383947 /DNA_START=56 /DNA_END=1429 /DNA_ORIENTATION=+
MPPKKKDGKKGKGGDRNSTPQNEPVDMKQLLQVTEALAKAKQLRNYFQLERDKINKFWDISKSELEAAKNELRIKDREIEEAEERHQVEMKVYKQKVRHLLYEHKVQVKQLKESGEKALAEATDEHKEKIGEMKKDKRGLHTNLKELLNQHEEDIKGARQGHQRLLSLRKAEAEKNMREMTEKYEKKIKILRDELELRRKAEIHDIEERKNEHIKELVAKHEAAFAEIKDYYNDITSKNLDLIKSLKEEVANMKKNEQYNEKLMFEIAQENKRLNEPLQKANKEVDTLRHELANYEKDKMSLKNTRSRLLVLEDQFKKLEETHTELEGQFSKVETERDNLVANFQDSLLDVRERAGFKNTILEQRLAEVQQELDTKDTQLSQVLQAAKLEPSSLELVTRKLEDMLETKNRAIKDLYFEMAKVEMQHRDAIKSYERKCTAAGLPPLNLINMGLIKAIV